jgi:hypothetical protein
MADWYVDNSVGGPGAGTIGDPWDDLESNFGSVSDGDTIHIVGDAAPARVYDEGEVVLSNSGSDGSPITVKALAGTQVVWNSGAGEKIFQLDGDYINIEDRLLHYRQLRNLQ